MKKTTQKKRNTLGLSLARPKFSVKTIYLLFAIALIAVQLYNGYEVYLLVDKVFHLFNNVTQSEVQFTNLSFLSEFYIALHESQPKLFGNNRILKSIAFGSKKLPVLLLYVFFGLIVVNYFLIPDFKMFYYLLVGIEHILIHKLLHFLQHQKHCNWYNCICWINKVKRYVRRKFNNIKPK